MDPGDLSVDPIDSTLPSLKSFVSEFRHGPSFTTLEFLLVPGTKLYQKKGSRTMKTKNDPYFDTTITFTEVSVKR